LFVEKKKSNESGATDLKDKACEGLGLNEVVK
jgi:hypothetical protein